MSTPFSENTEDLYTHNGTSMEERLFKIESTLKEILSRLDNVEDEVERMVDNDDVLCISQLQDYFDIIQNKRGRW